MLDLFSSCNEKQKKVITEFSELASTEEKYQKIITLGKTLSQKDPEIIKPENIVPGCQSLIYLSSFVDNDKIIFKAYSEALFSSGLAALLISIYSGENPLALLQCPPFFIEEIGLQNVISPSRSNGLQSLLLRMKQDALKAVVKK
jgi:cysteine desulfuration protein SufE